MKKLISRIRGLYETVVQSFEIASMMIAAGELQKMGRIKESEMVMKRAREIMANK